MTAYDFNRLNKDERRQARRSRTLGHGDVSDPSLKLLLNEETRGPVGKAADRGSRSTGAGGEEPDVDCFWCIVLCVLDIPSSDLKSMWGEVLKAQIAAQHYAGLPPNEAKEKGLIEYAKDVKSVAKITKKLATFIAYGEIEITVLKVVGKPTKPVSAKVKISSHHFPPLETLRWKIIKLLTKHATKEFLESLFKKFVLGYNVLDWILTVQKGTECVGKCIAAEVLQSVNQVAQAAGEVKDNVDELLKGFFDWLAEEFGQGFSKITKTLNPDNWKYAALLPAAAKAKISDIHYHFHLLALLPPSFESMKQLGTKLPEHGINNQTLQKTAEGIVEAFYFEAGGSPNASQKQKDIQEILQKIKKMTPYEFVKYLEDQNFVTLQMQAAQ